ncbi:hypothetical protein PVAND_008975 [Polypedilum vanderplanki]|uniref:Peptidase S1 domain-containing protein n=1 Tax=Polypedilum vanderplanki TaxID=319348 RepID=A0A9J6CBN7_POLVA|nr:hypothetical protein PVAND_008975 [Polypedilum vanderplanki]
MEITRNVILLFLSNIFLSQVPVESNLIQNKLENILNNNVTTRFTRIVGGSNAAVAQFPHAAALFLFLKTGESFCGGSIIHDQYILTAAHCLDDILRIEVQAGTLNIFQGVPRYRETVQPSHTRQHHQYDSDTLRNDIGLIYLMRPIPFSPAIRPIALPSRVTATSTFQGMLTTVIGWGRFEDAKQSLSDTLQFVRLPIVQDRQCTTVYNQFYNFFDTRTNICASGSHARSTCNGDSGGSMTIDTNGRPTLIGIVSFGSSTCEGGLPVAMTRVTAYLDWIAANSLVRC